MKFTINYKDHKGRKNKAQSFGTDYIEAEKKFKTLYPDCTIVSIETDINQIEIKEYYELGN